MASYLIGDLQGCYCSFVNLLELIDFSPSRDHLVLLGDLVNRGPQSLETLDAIVNMQGAVTCLIGNHDSHFLGVAYGLRKQRPMDTLTPLLQSPRLWQYIEFIRHQHMALYRDGWLMVHAGVVPQWTLEQTLCCAREVEAVLQSPDIKDFLMELFGNTPDIWSETLAGIDRLRFATNVFTRTRFCYADGRLDFKCKEGIASAPPELMPWFRVPGRLTENVPIAFGHWSTLGFTNELPNLLALDTGCLWGGKLTAAQIDTTKPPSQQGAIKLKQVQCPLYQDPLHFK